MFLSVFTRPFTTAQPLLPVVVVVVTWGLLQGYFYTNL